jgi:hypothetical protein
MRVCYVLPVAKYFLRFVNRITYLRVRIARLTHIDLKGDKSIVRQANL